MEFRTYPTGWHIEGDLPTSPSSSPTTMYVGHTVALVTHSAESPQATGGLQLPQFSALHWGLVDCMLTIGHFPLIGQMPAINVPNLVQKLPHLSLSCSQCCDHLACVWIINCGGMREGRGGGGRDLSVFNLVLK